MVAVPVATPPAFAAKVEHVTASDLRWSWRAGCPVGPSQLRRIRLRYLGFDGRAHTGEIIVNQGVVTQVTQIFRRLYGEHFPIRSIRPIDVFHGSDSRSTAADNTSSFNCRYAVAPGPKSWSMHAYGEAIDINTLENPYRLNGTVRPPAGATYMDRSNVRPGMIVAGSAPVRAFAEVRWGWGGNWSSTPDYQHFSVNGR